MTGQIKSWRAFGLRLALALLAAWVATLASLSGMYTTALLYPSCAPSTSTPPDYENVRLTTSSGITLPGWWRPPANGAAILLLGGHDANRDAMLPVAEILANHGYGVLTLSYRHCAGAAATLGYREVEELQAMAAFAASQPGVNWMGALGYSVGGVTVIRGAARMPELKAVIAEGNYANLYDEFTAEPAVPLSLQWQVQRLVALFYMLQTGIWPGQVNPLGDLARLSPRPVLLIHGQYEIERTRGLAQATAAGPGGELWIVPDAGHGQYLTTHPQEYERRVIAFFEHSRGKQ
jgi:hypothetical protein